MTDTTYQACSNSQTPGNQGCWLRAEFGTRPMNHSGFIDNTVSISLRAFRDTAHPISNTAKQSCDKVDSGHRAGFRLAMW